MPRPWPRKPKRDEVKPMKAPPYNRQKEGRGVCSHCHVKDGHSAGCAKGGS